MISKLRDKTMRPAPKDLGQYSQLLIKNKKHTTRRHPQKRRLVLSDSEAQTLTSVDWDKVKTDEDDDNKI
jgi:hypothetical protein